MADSTRRSGRATKGQHRGLEEVDVPPPVKKTGRGRKPGKAEPVKTIEADADEEEEEGDEENDKESIIRCICGAVTEEEEEVERKMICCEKCEAWQHNECMEMSENDDDLPEKYFCEQCRPRDHKALLEKVARGEKPWEERAKEREREEEERKARKGKGKKGRKSEARASTSSRKEDTSENGHTAEDAPMALGFSNEDADYTDMNGAESPQIGINKRKFNKDSVLEEPATKLRKPSSPLNGSTPQTNAAQRRSSGPASKRRESAVVTLQTELVERIEDLQSDDRRRVAAALSKMFEGQVKQAQKDGSFSLPDGQTVAAFALKLALNVEYAIYLNFFGTAATPSDQYGEKFRMINANVKINPSLRDQILSGDLSPNDFSKMSREDMASKELQEEKAKMLKQAEKQHMLIQETGPRLRRTHKGEELVDEQNHIGETTDASFAAPLRKRPSEIDTTMKEPSPGPFSGQSPEAVELPESVNATPIDVKPPLSIDTKSPAQSPAVPDRKSASTFNIQDVWSGVKGPDVDAQRTRQVSGTIRTVPEPAKQQADPDVLRLLEDGPLKDTEVEDDEPYSPVEYAADPNAAIWHGKMAMAGVASFNGEARHVAGANLSSSIPWSELVPNELIIEGRIDTARADDYLCGLRYSNSTDMVVVAVTAKGGAEDVAGFTKLFEYFTDRKRYGVISKNAIANVKDTYVVPLEKATTQKPGFVELLQYCTIETPSPERMLLLSFVVKMNGSPSTQGAPRSALDTAKLNSPSVAPPAPQHTPLPPAHSPPNNYNNNGSAYAPPPQPQPSHQLPRHANTPPYPHPHHAPNSNPKGTPSHGYALPTHLPPPNIGPGAMPYPYSHAPAGPKGMDAARQVLGPLAESPTIAELLKESPNSGVDEFKVIGELLNNVPAARTNINVLRGMLNARLQEQAGMTSGR